MACNVKIWHAMLTFTSTQHGFLSSMHSPKEKCLKPTFATESSNPASTESTAASLVKLSSNALQRSCQDQICINIYDHTLCKPWSVTAISSHTWHLCSRATSELSREVTVHSCCTPPAIRHRRSVIGRPRPSITWRLELLIIQRIKQPTCTT